jgi:hypothetical protein
MKTPVRLLLAFAVSLAACGPTITLSDEFSFDWSFLPWSRFHADLNSPYVTGTPVSLHVTSSDDHQDFTGWTVQSSDPTVFAIDSVTAAGDSVAVDAHTAGAGRVTLTVRDKNNGDVGHHDVEVFAPDRVELDAHAYLIIGDDADAPVAEVRIVEGGTATYLVRYFNGDRELHGNGVLTVNAPSSLAATTRRTIDFENREWLQLTATAADQTQIELVVNEISRGTVPVVVVPQTDIASVVMLSSPEKGHHDGDWLVAYAQAYDAQSRLLFGVDYEWDVAGVQQLGLGDLYRYEYKSGDLVTVTATFGGHSDSTTIQSDSGYVDSSNNLGCAAGGGAGGLVAIGGALALVIARRRRVRTDRTARAP